jgi:hypothetical protein
MTIFSQFVVLLAYAWPHRHRPTDDIQPAQRDGATARRQRHTACQHRHTYLELREHDLVGLASVALRQRLADARDDG